MQTIPELLAEELGQRKDYVENVITLLDEGNTVPFIARYRKEMHGAMDDQTIRGLADRLAYLRNLEARRQEVKNSIENQGKMTEELSAAMTVRGVRFSGETVSYRPIRFCWKDAAFLALLFAIFCIVLILERGGVL